MTNPLLRPGTVLDGYEVLGLLGKGGMGAVYRVRRGDAFFALKTLSGGDLVSPDQIARFRREGEVLAALDHPSIVRVHASGQAQGLFYLVMSLIEGESLDARIKRTGPLPQAVAGEIVLGVAEAIALAHARGIIHRDIKPANVLLESETGTPIVLDFGLARQMGDEAERLTKTGEIMGTPAYVAPELAFGLKDRLDERTDVYGLGALLYGALAGRPPFRGSSAIAVLKQVSMNEPPPIENVSPALASVVRHAMAKDRLQRTPSAEAFLDELEAALAAGEGLPRGLVLGLVATALVSVLLVTGLVLGKAYLGKGSDRGTGPVGSSSTAAAIISASLEEAVTAAPKDPGLARGLLRKLHARDPALTSEVAIEVARKAAASRDWARLAAACELFSTLELSPEKRRLLGDWRVVAEVGRTGKIDPGKLKKECQGRADLEGSPLADLVEEAYKRALSSDHVTALLLELYPLPPPPDQRAAVAKACLDAAHDLSEKHRELDVAKGLVKLAAILDLLQCAKNADPATPSLPDSLERALATTCAAGSVGVLSHGLPRDWDTTFQGDKKRSGFPDHPLYLFLRCRVKYRDNDFEGSLVDARKTLEEIGAQRSFCARRLAEFFVTDVYKGLEKKAFRILPIEREFAEVANSKIAWRELAQMYALSGNADAAKEARARAESADDLPEVPDGVSPGGR